MSDFTYEFKTSALKLETYEWDNVWLEQAPVKDAKRVLYIGDSISCATRRVATAKADNQILFDGFGTSKAVDNPFFMPSVELFAGQQGGRSAVLFNNGLHGWHLEDETEFKEHYEDMVKFILDFFKGAPVAIVLSTYIGIDDLKRVIVRNKVMSDIAEKHSLPVIDLFTVSEQAKDLMLQDKVHFTDKGYKALAEKVVESCLNLFAEV